jgi:hypothetical protein
LLSGEAGIGKSRLAAELLEQLAGEQHVRLRYFAPRNMRAALCIRLSVRWKRPPVLGAKTRPNSGATSLTPFSS